MSDMRFNSSRTSTFAGARSTTMDQGLRQYMLGVYNYMTLSLGITGLTALGTNMMTVVTDETGMHLTAAGHALYGSPLMWVVALAPLGVLFAMRSVSSVSTLRTLFMVFSVLMGISLSTVLLRYTGQSVTRVFFITAASFAGLSLFGYTTSKSLSSMGSFLVMGVWGLLIAMVVNMFMASSALQFAISIAGVVIFAGLTAWDTQSIKQMYYAGDDYGTTQIKSIHGAVSLYLDFLNLFQFLLSLMGDRR